MQCVPFLLLSLLVGLFTPWPELPGISGSHIDYLPDICKLPPKGGRCRANFLRFYFNVQNLTCEEFVYGGCRGNANNFINATECYLECQRYVEYPENSE